MERLSLKMAYPEWTEYREKNGLDPLGMQTSSIALYQSLMPGISNVTLRVRYYGYYAWLARTYSQRVRSTNPRDWQRYLRRAEALYALVAQRCGGETGVAGVTWAAKVLAEAPDKVDFAADAEPGSPTHYLQQAWGAYGAAYGTQLHTIGILADATEHSIAVPSTSVGEPTADAFAAALGPLARIVSDAIDAGTVSLGALDDLAPIRPSAIGSNGSERDLYERILFATAGLNRDQDQERRRSLLLLLTVVGHLKRAPSVSELRWLLYSGSDDDGHAIAWRTPILEAQRRRWWAYQANDLTHVAYEALLKLALDQLEPHQSGIPGEALLARVLEHLQSSGVLSGCSWAEFVAQQGGAKAEAEKTLSTDVMRAGRLEVATTPDDAAAALQLLAVVQSRVQIFRETIREQFGRLDPAVFRSVWSELGFLEKHGHESMDVFVSRLIEQRILRRHLWVAMRKLRHQGDYTFLIEADDGRIRLRAKDGPVLTNPRLGPALTFLKDIHLVGEHGLTDRGQQVLAQA